MKTIAILFAGTMLLAAAGPKQTFTGVISDDMCDKDHKNMMHVQPDSKCVIECVKAGSKYVLLSGANAYVLSDQKSPEKFAGQKVTVNGSLNGKTIQVDSIAPAK